VDIASQKAYGYIQSHGVTITASGDETHFSATARHEDSDKTWAIDAQGNVGQVN